MERGRALFKYFPCCNVFGIFQILTTRLNFERGRALYKHFPCGIAFDNVEILAARFELWRGGSSLKTLCGKPHFNFCTYLLTPAKSAAQWVKSGEE
jgi:hypothetical protein